MNIWVLLLILLLLGAFGGLPAWGYHNYGYAPSSILGVIVVIIVVLLLLGKI